MRITWDADHAHNTDADPGVAEDSGLESEGRPRREIRVAQCITVTVSGTLFGM